MTRRTYPRSAMGWAPAIVLALVAPAAGASDWLPYWPWSWAAPADPKLAPIVEALRAEEAKYRDIEYVVRIVGRDPQRRDPNAPSDVTTMVRRRVVFQGDRTYFRHEAFERVGAIKYRHEETSAYDGERTRTVIAGNCANIHLERWRHPRLLPAHTLPLAHHGINFPLSIYLGGTSAIHAYLGYPAWLAEANPWQSFRKIESHLEGEETIDGLRCARIRTDRWYQPNQPSNRQRIWLALDRNDLCIKEEQDLGVYRYELRVPELREAAPGIWFPARASLAISQANGPNPVNPPAAIRSDMTVESVSLSPRHEPAFFREVAIPDGLPTFTVSHRRVVDAMPPQPFDDDWGREKMAELVRRVGEQERRYDALEVTSRTLSIHPHIFIASQDNSFDALSEERLVVRGDRAWAGVRRKVDGPAGWAENGSTTIAYDGEWTRWSRRWGSPEAPQLIRATLRRGSMPGGRAQLGGVRAHRPHAMVLRNLKLGPIESLEELLASGREDVAAWPFRFRYGGAAEVDGRRCIQVRGDTAEHPANGSQSLVLYLDADRNEIPLKVEHHLKPAGQPPILLSVTRCGDLREIAPGLWYPFRVTRCESSWASMLSDGWFVLSARSEASVESVAPASRDDDAVFRDAQSPAGTPVRVMDESGRYIGQVQQAEDGVFGISLKGYLALSCRARRDPQFQQLRAQEAQVQDTPIGRTIPEFPRGATWLGGGPPTRESLRGRVVVLGFWAEWDDDGREDLVRLNQFHRDGGTDGPTVIGVHPPGSEPAEVARAIDAMQLGFPVCLDVPGAGGADAWGVFSGRLGVGSIPHFVVVDREGKVAASGTLEQAMEKARALVQHGR